MRFSETLRWIIGGLLSIILVLVMMAFDSVKADVADLKVQVPKNTSSIAVIDTQQHNQDRKLDKIQSDLDWLVKRELEHTDGHPPGKRLP